MLAPGGGPESPRRFTVICTHVLVRTDSIDATRVLCTPTTARSEWGRGVRVRRCAEVCRARAPLGPAGPALHACALVRVARRITRLQFFPFDRQRSYDLQFVKQFLNWGPGLVLPGSAEERDR